MQINKHGTSSEQLGGCRQAQGTAERSHGSNVLDFPRVVQDGPGVGQVAPVIGNRREGHDWSTPTGVGVGPGGGVHRCVWRYLWENKE